jgi:hypothetical protein
MKVAKSSLAIGVEVAKMFPVKAQTELPPGGRPWHHGQMHLIKNSTSHARN